MQHATNEDRIKALFSATPTQLAAVDAALAGKTENENLSLRLLRVGQFARESNLSRTTCWRMIREGRLRAVEIRPGSRRIPEQELRRLVAGA